MPLLERDTEVSELLAAAAEVLVSREGRAVLVTGEAGIGKTSVIREFLAHTGDDLRVLRGGCDDLRTPRTFGPLLDAAAGTGGPLEEALAGGRGDAVYDAVIGELTGSRPTVLVVEDVHWADDATIDVLRYVVRRLTDLPVLLVLSFRDDAAAYATRLSPLVATLAGSEARRVEPQPLSADGVARLAADFGRDAGALYQHTGGNPFYLSELLAAGGSDVPVTVSDAVQARVAKLPPETVRALEQLSVVPAQLDYAEAGELFGSAEVLLAAEEVGIVEVTDAGVAFRHELARRAVEAGLPALTRRRLNAVVLRHLLGRDDEPDLARIVHHAVEADDVATILAYAPRAGREASRRGARRQALEHFETVLPYAGRLGLADRAALYGDYAWDLQYAQRYADAVAAGRVAAELRERLGDPVALAEQLVWLGRELYLSGDTMAARDASDRAAAIADSLDPGAPGAAAVLAVATTFHGMMLVRVVRSAEARPVLERALVLAADAGRPDLQSLCRNFLAMARADLGDPGAIGDLQQQLRTAIESGDHQTTAHLYSHLAELHFRYGEYDELAEVVDRGLVFTRERGFAGNQYNLEVLQAALRIRHGDWAAAERQLRRLVDSLDDPGMLYVYSVPSYGRLLARRGDPRAERMLTESWERARAQRHLLGIAFAGLGYVEWAWLAGRPDLVAEAAELLLDGTPGGVPALHGELELYLRRAGIGHGGPGFDGCPEVYAAGIRGDWKTAAELWERIGDPYEQGIELSHSDDPATALTGLRMLDELDARPAAAIVRARLRGLGIRVPRGARRSTRRNPAGLTDRQLDVLGLLADGLTNAEIAERLVVSVRTVDHHVSDILGKLGVDSRRAAAAYFVN